MAATSNKGTNNINAKMKTLLATEKAVLGQVQRKNEKKRRKR